MIPVYKIFKAYRNKFHKQVMPHEKISKGILISEAFAFCALADYFKVDLIFESGVCYGGSTEMWCKYFTKKTFLNVKPVTAIDIKILSEAAVRLLPYRNKLNLLEGNSLKIMPLMISEITNGSIAVFIDGPKNQRGVALAKRCLSFPQVKLVAIHDMCQIFYNKDLCIGRQLMDEWNGVHKFYTDDSIFINNYKYLDGSFADKLSKKYVYDNKICKGGYGPTLGLIWKGAENEVSDCL